MDASGPGISPLRSLVIARAPRYLRHSVSIQSWAIFCRITGSLVRTRPSFSMRRASSMRPSSAMRSRTWSPNPSARRSYISVVSPTCQPLLRPPRISDSWTRTLSKKTSELGIARDLLERLHRHAGQAHVEQEVRDALVPRRVGIGPRQQHHAIGDVGQRRPHLLPVDHPVLAVFHGTSLERREIGPGVRLRIPLAPDLFAGEDLGRIPLLLLLGPVGDDRRPGHADAEDVQDLRRLGQRHLLVEDQLLHEGEATPAVLLGPRQSDEPRVVERALPVAKKLIRLGSRNLRAGHDATGPVTRNVLFEPRADLLAKRVLFGSEREVQNRLLEGETDQLNRDSF